jgi:homoaconitase/3-isopropylmalate dehydratase large subunit
VYDIDRVSGPSPDREDRRPVPAVSTDSHTNILGPSGIGQGWRPRHRSLLAPGLYLVQGTFSKLVLKGSTANGISAKDITLNLLERFGASSLLGTSIEVEGEMVGSLTLDQRITIASMATEMGAITLLFPPSREVIRYCESRSRKKITPHAADPDAVYEQVHLVDAGKFSQRIALPGNPHDVSGLPATRVWIDSAFIGSCTNGRIEDMRSAATVLKNRKVAPGVVMKIVPQPISIVMPGGRIIGLSEAGAIVSNAGCRLCGRSG